MVLIDTIKVGSVSAETPAIPEERSLIGLSLLGHTTSSRGFRRRGRLAIQKPGCSAQVNTFWAGAPAEPLCHSTRAIAVGCMLAILRSILALLGAVGKSSPAGRLGRQAGLWTGQSLQRMLRSAEVAGGRDPGGDWAAETGLPRGAFASLASLAGWSSHLAQHWAERVSAEWISRFGVVRVAGCTSRQAPWPTMSIVQPGVSRHRPLRLQTHKQPAHLASMPERARRCPLGL